MTAFFEKVVEGVGVERGSHEFLLARRLDDLSKRRTTADQVEIAALVIKTWNKIRAGEPVGKVLSWRPNAGEAFPRPE